ncbi:MAG: hypothetical protein ACREGC_02950 [Minisyncoccia bacterium]
MNDDTIQDLKQFISTTVSQQMANVATKDDIARIEKKIDHVQAAVEQSVIGYTSAVDEQVQDHEKRLAHLEHKAA